MAVSERVTLLTHLYLIYNIVIQTQMIIFLMKNSRKSAVAKANTSISNWRTASMYLIKKVA